jgi:glycosyltransferase involved in cell wall biosynthesis
MDPEDVTSIVPCYDTGETLPRVLSAIDALDPSPARVVCVDDGSTDGTRVIEAHEGVELVAHAHNRGLGATLNAGLDRTETPEVAKIDADILVEPDWVGRLCAHIDDRDLFFRAGSPPRLRNYLSDAPGRTTCGRATTSGCWNCSSGGPTPGP